MVNCTLCLTEKSDKDTFLPINNFIEKLKFCISQQKFSFSDKDYICEFCIKLLNNQYEFKNVCLYESTETENTENENSEFICRICSKPIIDDDLISVNIQNESADSQIAIKILKECFRKLYNKIIFIPIRKNPIICYGCWRNLKNFYTFFQMIINNTSTKKIVKKPRRKVHKCNECEFKTNIRLTLQNHKLLNHAGDSSDTGEVDIVYVETDEQISAYFHNYHKTLQYKEQPQQVNFQRRTALHHKESKTQTDSLKLRTFQEKIRRSFLKNQLINLHKILFPETKPGKFSQIKVISRAIKECQFLRVDYHNLNKEIHDLEMQKYNLLDKIGELKESLPF